MQIPHINGRDRNLLGNVYCQLDEVAARSEWEQFWQKKGIKPLGEFDSDRKFIYDQDDKTWTYGDPGFNVAVPNEEMNQFLQSP